MHYRVRIIGHYQRFLQVNGNEDGDDKREVMVQKINCDEFRRLVNNIQSRRLLLTSWKATNRTIEKSKREYTKSKFNRNEPKSHRIPEKEINGTRTAQKETKDPSLNWEVKKVLHKQFNKR